MTTALQIQSHDSRAKSSGGVWYDLHSEREEICLALLRNTQRTADGGESQQPRPLLLRFDVDRRLQTRLRLVDEELDRLLSGSYGDCVTCGRWIEDSRLRSDAAFPFCIACEHEWRSTQGTSH